MDFILFVIVLIAAAIYVSRQDFPSNDSDCNQRRK